MWLNISVNSEQYPHYGTRFNTTIPKVAKKAHSFASMLFLALTDQRNDVKMFRTQVESRAASECIGFIATVRNI